MHFPRAEAEPAAPAVLPEPQADPMKTPIRRRAARRRSSRCRRASPSAYGSSSAHKRPPQICASAFIIRLFQYSKLSSEQRPVSGVRPRQYRRARKTSRWRSSRSSFRRRPPSPPNGSQAGRASDLAPGERRHIIEAQTRRILDRVVRRAGRLAPPAGTLCVSRRRIVAETATGARGGKREMSKPIEPTPAAVRDAIARGGWRAPRRH